MSGYSPANHGDVETPAPASTRGTTPSSSTLPSSRLEHGSTPEAAEHGAKPHGHESAVGAAEHGAKAPASSSPVDGLQHTSHGSILGTPGYMAPEQARGDVKSLDARSGVSALGAVLLFLLTCRTQREAPAPLLAACQKAMAAAQEDRYPDALALGVDVARYLDGRRVEAFPEGLLHKTARLYARHKTAFWLIVAYLVVRGSVLFFTRR